MGMPQSTTEWTVAMLADLPDDGNRYEVIEGELIVSPAPSILHQAALGKLYLLVEPYLASIGRSRAFVAPLDVTFSAKSGVQPDLLAMPLLDGARLPKVFTDVGRLVLAVEILSPSTQRTDRTKKRALYRTHGVPDYWVVDLDDRIIERTTPKDLIVESIGDRLVWQPYADHAPLVIDVAEYFRSVH